MLDKPIVRAHYMRALVLILCLTVMTMLSGCNDNSSDERLRKVLGVETSANISEAVIAERVKKLIPVGTAEPEIARKVAALGVGGDNLSSYTLISKRSMAVVRVEFDPTTFGLVKSQWIIALHLDSSLKLSSVTANRYLVGL